MKILYSDYRKGIAKVQISNADDLWYLTQIIDSGDLISGSTERKIKIGDSGTDRNVKVVRKKVTLEIKTEKVELAESLRVLGTITNGPDDISFGSHHSFDLDINDTITITKERWFKFQIEKLNDASKNIESNILIVVFDREEAFIALLRSIGVKHLAHITGEVQKKDENNQIISNFYIYLLETIQNYDKKDNYSKIICASPAFWKNEFAKNIKDSKIRQKIIYSTCSSVGRGAFNEVLKRPEISQALRDERMSKELIIIDDLLKEVSKDNAAYGFDHVDNAVNSGAVKVLTISSKLIKDFREKNDYEKLEKLMKSADDMKAEIILIDSNNDAGKKLDGIGGIGAILRFKIHQL